MCSLEMTGLAILALVGIGCHKSSGEAASPPTRVPVSTYTVRRDSIAESMSLVGRLTPPPGEWVILTAPADAVVRSVRAQVGQSVARGTLLIDLDAPDLLNQARSLRAEARNAEQEAQRQQELLASGITSRRQAEEQAATATSKSAAAEAAEQLLARTRVTSPIRGAVQEIMVNAGERVRSGDSLAEVVNGKNLDLVATAPAAVLTRLRPGISATVQMEGSPQLAIGTVHGISPALDTTTNAGTVVIRLQRFGDSFRPGAGATASVTVGVHRDVLVVPDSAIVAQGSGMVVFVIQPDSTVKAVPVMVGTKTGGLAEVSGQLRPGDKVVTTGAYGLADGMHVIPTEARRP